MYALIRTMFKINYKNGLIYIILIHMKVKNNKILFNYCSFDI